MWTFPSLSDSFYVLDPYVSWRGSKIRIHITTYADPHHCLNIGLFCVQGLPAESPERGRRLCSCLQVGGYEQPMNQIQFNIVDREH